MLADTSAGLSAKLRALIFSCLDRDPRARPAFDLIVEHLRYAVSLSDALFADNESVGEIDEEKIEIGAKCLGGFAADVERIASGLEIGFLWRAGVEKDETRTIADSGPILLNDLRSHAFKMSIESSLGPGAVGNLAAAAATAAEIAALEIVSGTTVAAANGGKALPRWKQLKLEKEKRAHQAVAAGGAQRSMKKLNALKTQNSSAAPLGRNRALTAQVGESKLAWLELRNKIGAIASAQFCPLAAARELHGIASTVVEAMGEHRRDGAAENEPDKMQRHYKYTFDLSSGEGEGDEAEEDAGFRLSRATDLQTALLQSLPIFFDRMGALLTVAVTGRTPWSVGTTAQRVSLLDLWRVARLRRHGHQWAQTVSSLEGDLAGGVSSIEIAKECVKTMLVLFRATELEQRVAAIRRARKQAAATPTTPLLLRASSGDSIATSSSRRSLRKSQRNLSGRHLSARTLSRFSSRGEFWSGLFVSTPTSLPTNSRNFIIQDRLETFCKKNLKRCQGERPESTRR